MGQNNILLLFLLLLLVGNKTESFSISNTAIRHLNHSKQTHSQKRRCMTNANANTNANTNTILSSQLNDDNNNGGGDVDTGDANTNSNTNSDDDHDHDDASYSIENTLNNIGNKITKGKGPKEINTELVSLGQEFDSFRRRFDYLELLGKMAIDNDSGNDNSHSHSHSQQNQSLWERDNDQSVNVASFLIASSSSGSGSGMSLEEANVQAQSLHTQSYHRVTSSVSMDANANTNTNTNIQLQVNTHDGIPTTVDTTNETDGHDDSYGHGNGYGNGHGQRMKVSWEGNKYVTKMFINDDSKKDKVVVRVEKYLSFTNNDDGDGDTPGIGNMVMIVNSTFYAHDNDDDANDETEPETTSCQEIFRPVYAWKERDGMSSILASGIDRVPGCVANVNVRTTLVPIDDNGKANGNDDGNKQQQLYRVIVDGEADALLSRGLLSVISSSLSSLTSREVLSIDSFTIADELKLRSVLSTGRNDGLSNMVVVVQDQIHQIINRIEKQGQQSDVDTDTNVISEKNNSENEVEENQEESSRKPTVAMLLSGGVDSAVALNLLRQQNYNVTAFYLKIWLEDELAHLGQCPWEDDYNTCISVCEHAGDIPLEAISLQDAYKERVISYTISEARKGRTPNPDIMCNSRIKFGCFYDAIADRGFDYVASGHYAQLENVSEGDTNVMKLLRAPDPVKDQSYFLAALRQDQLKRVLFPIGHLQKSEVRTLAQEFDLPNKSRPDSQGLCFLGKVKFDEFLSAYLGKEPGDIIDADTAEIIGRHNGIWFHTVGQRKGIGKVLDPKATSRGPWYVVAKDPSNRKIIASNKYDEEVFKETRSEFYVEDIKWISGFEPKQLKTDDSNTMKLTMKIRHGPTIVHGVLHFDTTDTGTIILEEKDGGLAPGQFVAFYDDIECLGSGVISEKHWMKFQTDVKDKTNEDVKVG